MRGLPRRAVLALFAVSALSACPDKNAPPKEPPEEIKAAPKTEEVKATPKTEEVKATPKKEEALPAGVACVEDGNKKIEDGKLTACKLDKELARGAITCGSGYMAGFYRDGTLKFCSPVKTTELDGTSCKGTITVYRGGKLRRCELAADRKVGEIELKADDWVTFYENGGPLRVERGSARRHGKLQCKGETFFHDDGKLKRCTLAKPAKVDGKKIAADELLCLDRDGKPTECTSVLSEVADPPG